MLGRLVLEKSGLGQRTWEEVLAREEEAKSRLELQTTTSPQRI
jgi:hypothetical protein